MLFSYGKVVTGKYFYDRVKMRRELDKIIHSGQSFMLKAPRRYGKTSILKQTLKEANREYFYADFRKIPRLEVFNNKLLEFTYSLMGIEGAIAQLKENLVTFLIKHRTTVGVKASIFEASVELFASNKKDEDKFVEVLELLGEVSQEQDLVVNLVFDEFQDAIKMSKSIDVLEVMRGEIQHHENCCYIFAGSNMTLMTEIFEKKKAPFYNFCRKIPLKPFDSNELAQEIVVAFKSRAIVFESNDVLVELIDKCGGHPANTMLVLQTIEYKMLDMDIKSITRDIASECYEDAKEEMSDLVCEYLKEIRTKEHLHDVIYREANEQPHILEASSLQQKRKYLVNMGHLQHLGRGEYMIIDNFLKDELVEQAQ